MTSHINTITCPSAFESSTAFSATFTKGTMKPDTAVLKLLKLDADTTSVSSAGGGGCSSASTSKIVSKLNDGTEKIFFMKTGSGSAAEVMFEGQTSMKYVDCELND